MSSVSLSDKYDDLVESVSVWYGFFRQRGVEPGPATSRVMGQLHSILEDNRYLLLLAYLILVEEVLGERDPDEELLLYLFINLKEDCGNVLMTARLLAEQISQDQRDDLIQHLETIERGLVSLASPSMDRILEELRLVG